MIEQQVKKATGYKGKEADVHMIEKRPKGLRGVTSTYTTLNAQPYHLEGNVNAISIVDESIPDFSSPSLPWKAMFWALAQESHCFGEHRIPRF